MRKWMFNDRFGLNDSVLDGTKTKTRRIASRIVRQWEIAEELTSILGNPTQRELTLKEFALKVCPIKVGEIIAVAQPYRTLIEKGFLHDEERGGWVSEEFIVVPGYRNKMFVKAEHMPVKVKVTDIDFECLQDITDEDCLAEGIMYDPKAVAKYGYRVGVGKSKWYRTPKDAFSALIDKVSGRGTWDSNPYVYVFSFKLID